MMIFCLSNERNEVLQLRRCCFRKRKRARQGEKGLCCTHSAMPSIPVPEHTRLMPFSSRIDDETNECALVACTVRPRQSPCKLVGVLKEAFNSSTAKHHRTCKHGGSGHSCMPYLASCHASTASVGRGRYTGGGSDSGGDSTAKGVRLCTSQCGCVCGKCGRVARVQGMVGGSGCACVHYVCGSTQRYYSSGLIFKYVWSRYT